MEEEVVELPEPSPHWQRKIEALEEADLWRQRQAAIFAMRCEQAEKMGFERLTSEEMVEMIMGETNTHQKEARTDRQTHEFFYNHHTDETQEGKDCSWGGKPEDFYRIEKRGLWYYPPFSKIEKWRCRFGKLDYLKRQIHYGVVLRMLEVKKLNLFNVFNVLAPIEAWEKETDIDPIVVATIWEVTDKDDKSPETFNTAGEVAHFFLAQW
jgi:hypothetical protein